MKREFKVGDLVYGSIDNETIFLSQVSSEDVSCRNLPIVVVYRGCKFETFTKGGKYLFGKPFQCLFHANEETYAALVTLYGKENVPPLPPRPSRHDIIVELLKRQKFVICLTSDISYEDALNNYNCRIIVQADCDSHTYEGVDSLNWKYAIAVDLNCNEITKVPQ